jgi:hypothetical protein
LAGRGAGHQLRAGDADDDHGDVVRPAPQVGQVDQHADRLGRRQALEDGAQLLVADLTRQPVAAQQEGVADLYREGAFQVDLHVGLGSQRAGDDVLGHVGQGLADRLAPGPLQLPHQAVIEGQLLQVAAAEPVGPAVPHVGQHRPLG